MLERLWSKRITGCLKTPSCLLALRKTKTDPKNNLRNLLTFTASPKQTKQQTKAAAFGVFLTASSMFSSMPCQDVEHGHGHGHSHSLGHVHGAENIFEAPRCLPLDRSVFFLRAGAGYVFVVLWCLCFCFSLAPYAKNIRRPSLRAKSFFMSDLSSLNKNAFIYEEKRRCFCHYDQTKRPLLGDNIMIQMFWEVFVTGRSLPNCFRSSVAEARCVSSCISHLILQSP